MGGVRAIVDEDLSAHEHLVGAYDRAALPVIAEVSSDPVEFFPGARLVPEPRPGDDVGIKPVVIELLQCVFGSVDERQGFVKAGGVDGFQDRLYGFFAVFISVFADHVPAFEVFAVDEHLRIACDHLGVSDDLTAPVAQDVVHIHENDFA